MVGARIVYITNIARKYSNMHEALGDLQKGRLAGNPSAVILLDKTASWSPAWEDKLGSADLVLIRYMGKTVSTRFLKFCSRYLKFRKIPFYIEAPGSLEGIELFLLNGQAARQLKEYSFLGGPENLSNFWLYGISLFDSSVQDVEKPKKMVWAGIYHPRMKERYMADLSAYLAQFCKPGRRTIGILFYRNEWLSNDTACLDALIEEIERRNANAVAVFSNGTPDAAMGMPTLSQVFRDFFCQQGKAVVDAVITMMEFSFVASGAASVMDLKALGVPWIEAYSLSTTEEEWRSSPEGMNAKEVSINMALPEIQGVIHSAPAACREAGKEGTVHVLPVKGRIPFVVGKVLKWAALGRKNNGDKKVAIIFHNYPPKNSSIGSAFGLDSIESIRRLLGRMKDMGYKVDRIPRDTAEFMKMLTTQGTNDISMLPADAIRKFPRMSAAAYKDCFRKYPAKVKQEMTKAWGEAPGTVMVDDHSQILVPGVMDGNVFITVQPPRGYGVDPERIYHDVHIPPTHQYMAVYEWIRHVWKSDVALHVGTHGNLEWLPGKGAGLDEASYPGLALDDLPNVYIYHMTITGEGIQAKRRGAACLVDHYPAPMENAGAYDDLAELDKELDEYAHFKVTQPENLQTMENIIREAAAKAHLDEEVPFDDTAPFDSYVGRLHTYLEEIENSETHTGLHILGDVPEGDLLQNTIEQLLKVPNHDMPSIYDLFAEKWGSTYYDLQEKASEILPDRLSGGEALKEIQKEMDDFVSCLVQYDFTEAGVERAMNLACFRDCSREWLEKVRSMAEFICRQVYEKIRLTETEMGHVLDGFSGKYIEPGPSGSPDAGGLGLLPSGRNFYGLDPRRLPTKAAWELGKQLGDQVIHDYIVTEGRYPENIGMIFWAGANMRSSGQCIAEFLYFLGLRPIWEKGSLYVKGLEVIPLSELGRPRIDVMGRISGFFRDSLGTAVQLLDQAVKTVAGLPESGEDNYVKKHISEQASQLMKEGSDEKEAWERAGYRLFGDAPGTYGAGVSALLENKNWDSVDDLANAYINWGGYAYGKNVSGAPAADMFRSRLSVTNVTIKNEDNHETSIMSSDDFNGYHGGMIAAVRSLSGKAPKSYSGDSTNRSHVRVRTLKEEVNRIFRAETINPKFISGMMKHGYKGAQDLAGRASITFQWDATSHVVDDWMYESMARKYALDPKVQEWMKKVNPWALERIVETLLEAEQRKLWNAEDDTLSKLQELYLSIDGELEESADT